MDKKMHTCRICYQKQEVLFSLFTKEKSSSPYTKLIRNTKLNIKAGDGGPSSICTQCLTELDITVNFLDKCERANQVFASYSQKITYTATRAPDKSDEFVKSYDYYFSQSLPENFTDIQDNNKTGIIKKEPSVSEVLEAALKPSQCPECGSKRRCKHWSPPSTHTCQFCQKVFNRKFNFTLHLERHAGAAGEAGEARAGGQARAWRCGVCGAAAASRWRAGRHCAPRVRRACPLPACPKTFTTAANLRTHLRAHYGERPFKCDDCGKGFYCKNTLKDHVRIHTGVKPYMCQVCGRQFTTNKLAAHEARHRRLAAPRELREPNKPPARREPPATPAQPHACPVCSTRYSHKQSLNKHIRKQHPQEHAQGLTRAASSDKALRTECTSTVK